LTVKYDALCKAHDRQMIPAAFEELINKQTDVFSVTFALCGLNIKYI